MSREGIDDATPRVVQAADLLLAALLVVAPLLVGLSHPSTWLGAAVLCTVAVVLIASGSERFGLPHPAMSVLMACAALSALALLVPVPAGLRGALSPAAEALRTIPPAVPDSAALPLHLAPGEGAFAAVKLWTVVMFALAVSARAGSERWRGAALRVFVVSGVLSAAVTVLHTGLGMRDLFGVYTPGQDGRVFWLAPLINENHWGAWLGMVVPVALGLGTAAKGHVRAGMAWGAIGLALFGLALLGPSRSGLGGLLVGIALLVLGRALLGQSERVSPRRAVGVLVLIAVLAVPFLLRIAEQTPVQRDVITGEEITALESEARRHLIPEALDLVRDHRWTGVGAGAFYDVFPRYRHVSSGRQMNAFVESLPVQVLADQGLVLGGVMLLAGLLLLGSMVRSALRHPRRIGAAAAVVGLAVHELADFATHQGAVILGAVLLIAVALGGRRSRGVRPAWVLAGVGVGALIAVAVVLPHYEAPLDEDIAAILAEPKAAAEVLTAAEDQLLLRWPSSYLAAQDLMRLRAWRGDLQRALVLANRAIVLNPRHADPHLLTARLLHGAGIPAQAWLSYREALRWDWRTGSRAIVSEVLAKTADVEPLVRIVPAERPNAMARVAMVTQELGDPRGHALALRARDDDAAGPLTALVVGRALIAQGDSDGAAETLLDGLSSTEVSNGIRLRMLRELRNAGRGGEARRQLSELLARQSWGEAADGWLLLGVWLLDAGEIDEARGALSRASTAPSSQTRALSLYHRSRIELNAGRTDAALSLLDRAVVEWDGNPTILVASAALLARKGLTTSALARAERALYLEPGNVAAKGLVTELTGAERSNPDGG